MAWLEDQHVSDYEDYRFRGLKIEKRRKYRKFSLVLHWCNHLSQKPRPRPASRHWRLDLVRNWSRSNLVALHVAPVSTKRIKITRPVQHCHRSRSMLMSGAGACDFRGHRSIVPKMPLEAGETPHVVPGRIFAIRRALGRIGFDRWRRGPTAQSRGWGALMGIDRGAEEEFIGTFTR
jgi:hypothetical protein